MKLSPHFSLAELTRSMVATRRGIANEPDADQTNALQALCESVLEPIREHFGKPVRVSSGFRSEELNRAIGGSPKSEHRLGRAADIEIWGVSNLELAEWIRDSGVPFNQLILEFHDPEYGPNSGWVHVSYAPEPMGQVLTASRIDGRTVYQSGLRT